jgi:uncharacterized LabA/DUF88 family protein
MQNTAVLLDSGYLSKITKHFGGEKHFPIDIKNFGNTLAKEQDLWCDSVYYYVSPPFQSDPPIEEEIQRKARYDHFIFKINKIPGIIIREGRCQKLEDGYHQKGVDPLLSMDLLELCLKKKYMTIILLACDTDFVPVIQRARTEGCEIILYFYNDYIRGSKFSMSNHILTACDKCVLLTKDHFIKSERRKTVVDEKQLSLREFQEGKN